MKHEIVITRAVVIAIVVSPFMFFAYNLFPVVEKVSTPLFEFSFTTYSNLNVSAWYFANRFLTFTLLTLWFITCKKSWYNLILILIVYELYHVVATILLFLRNNDIVTGGEFYLVLIVLLCCLVYYEFIAYLRYVYFEALSKTKTVYELLQIELDSELPIESKFSLEKYKLFKENLSEIEARKTTMNNKEYLRELIKLRDAYKQA